MTYKKRILTFLGGLLLLLLTSCASAPAADGPQESQNAQQTSAQPEETAEPTPTSAPTPTKTPAPAPQQVLDVLQSADIFTYIPADIYAREEGQRWYEPVVADPELTLSLPERYDEWVDAAAELIKDMDGVDAVSVQGTDPDWPLLAAITANYTGDPEGMREALYLAGGFSCEIKENDDGTNEARIILTAPNPNDLMYSLPESDVTNAFSLLASYAYLATVFDESLHGREGIGTPELEEMLFPIANPARYYVGDCWALPRDGGARLHTGTDINAPEGTDLYAVVDGTVIANGYNPVAGNYVVLKGADGTQYHYYHLVELSDVQPGTVVLRGDVVGHVGSTGNSRANHLHFTIISADGYYVNPYTYLAEAQKETVAALKAAG